MDFKKEKLRSIWKMNKEKLIFIFCSGLLLFVLSLPSDGDSVAAGNTGLEKQAENGNAWADTGIETVGKEVVGSKMTYEAELESRVREILANVEGVGEVEVMIVLKSSEEETVHTSFSEKSVFPELSGIVVSADGGGSAVVEAEISGAMEALFGLPSHKIKVLKRVKKESEE